MMDPVHNMEHVPVADDGNVSLEEAYQHDGDVEAAVVGGIAAAAAATTVPDTSLLRLIEHEDHEHYLEWLAFGAGAGEISALVWSIARRGVMGELWMRCVHASMVPLAGYNRGYGYWVSYGDTNPFSPFHFIGSSRSLAMVHCCMHTLFYSRYLLYHTYSYLPGGRVDTSYSFLP